MEESRVPHLEEEAHLASVTYRVSKAVTAVASGAEATKQAPPTASGFELGEDGRVDDDHQGRDVVEGVADLSGWWCLLLDKHRHREKEPTDWNTRFALLGSGPAS